MPLRRIAFLLTEDHALLSTAAAFEPLRAANHLSGETLYDLKILSLRGGAPRSSAGSWFAAEPIARAGAEHDLVFVVAGGDALPRAEPAAAAWLRRAAAAGARLGGISGGAAVLARAGLMAGRRFTVHWHYYDALRALSEEYLLERRIFVIDRDRYTCAGGSAPLDMMHAIIARDHGAAFARRISDWFIQTEIRAPEAPQQAGLAARHAAAPGPVRSALALMETHIADPLTLTQLAELVGVSGRQLQRLFHRSLGAAVMAAYRDLRLETAQALLTGSTLSLGAIAQATGFASPSHFTEAYRRKFARPPSAARRSRRSVYSTMTLEPPWPSPRTRGGVHQDADGPRDPGSRPG